MAEKPIKTPLPADLPENWTAGQIVAPDGSAVGLSEQHGYNYLMAAVNRAQRGVNAVNEAFETVSGKRTCRFTVGTSRAGWTAADCDYLCDGVDDQVEINQALNTLNVVGGEVVLLDGDYNLSGVVTIPIWCVLRGNGIGTRLMRTEAAAGGEECRQIITVRGLLCDLLYIGAFVTTWPEEQYEICIRGGSVANVDFRWCGQALCVMSAGDGADMSRIVNCSGSSVHTCFVFVSTNNGTLLVENNYVSMGGGMFLDTAEGQCPLLIIKGNYGSNPYCGKIRLRRSSNQMGGSIIEGNCLYRLEIDDDVGNSGLQVGNLIIGNIFATTGSTSEAGPVIVLGEKSGGNFVVGNMLLRPYENANYAIQDLGTNNIVRFNSDDPGGSTPATVQQATPTISVNADGTVTARATQAAGYVAAGTRSATHQLSAADDTDLKPGNIKDGVSIFGVQGTLETGGSTAGVTSFNGRTGAVVPGNEDYTAADVGAIPAAAVKSVQVVTQAEYDALTTKDTSVLYLIKE